jgi:hypothetical protein
VRVRANIPKPPRSRSTATAKASAAIGTKKADRNDLVKHGSDSRDGLDSGGPAKFVSRLLLGELD